MLNLHLLWSNQFHSQNTLHTSTGIFGKSWKHVKTCENYLALPATLFASVPAGWRNKKTIFLICMLQICCCFSKWHSQCQPFQPQRRQQKIGQPHGSGSGASIRLLRIYSMITSSRHNIPKWPKTVLRYMFFFLWHPSFPEHDWH